MGGQGERRRVWPWAAALMALAAALLYMYWPAGPVKIIVSRETTHILGPLNADGTVNYVKYLDEKYAEGVTPENNAAPLLLRAIGPDMLREEVRKETLRRLGLTGEIFDANRHFVLWEKRVRAATAPATDPAAAVPNFLGGAMVDVRRAQEQVRAAREAKRRLDPELRDVYEMLLAGQVHPELESWLAGNAEALRLLRQAAARGKLYVPLVSRSDPPQLLDVLVPGWASYGEAARALTMRGLLRASGGDMEGAWEDVLAASAMARLLDRSPFLLNRLNGMGVDQIAAEGGLALASRYSMDPPLGRRVLGRLRDLAPRGDVVDVVDQERFLALDAVMMLSRGKERGRNALGISAMVSADLDWNEMLRHVQGWYDRMLAPMRLPRFGGREEAQELYGRQVSQFEAEVVGGGKSVLRAICREWGGRAARAARTRYTGDVLLSVLLPSFGPSVSLEDQIRMTHEIEALAVALACFRAENGRWPAELKELCPSLLAKIPTDRFSRDGLIYRPGETGYLLYSVGANLRDDGGQRDPSNSDKPANKRKDDIAAQVKARP